MGGSYTYIDIIVIKLCMYVSHIIWCVSLPKKMAESEEELKSLLMKVKVESEKVGLKLNSEN